MFPFDVARISKPKQISAAAAAAVAFEAAANIVEM